MTHSLEYRARAMELAEAGEPMAKIAKAMGRKYCAMKNYCRQHEIKVTPVPYKMRGMFDHEKVYRNQQIVEDYICGSTLREIAVKHGISKSRVHHILMKLGCAKRRRRPRLIVTSAHLQQHYKADHDT